MAQDGERVNTAIERTERDSHLIMGGSPAGLRSDQRLQRLQCGDRIAGGPTGDAQEQRGPRMGRHYLEDFESLLRGLYRIAPEQSGRMIQRRR
jgi:hypothetical protein